MKILLLNIFTLLAATSYASESRYLVNQQSAKNGALELGYEQHHENLSERGHLSKNGKIVKLNYTQPLGEVTNINVGAQFLNQEVSSAETDQTHSVTGFGDFNLGIKSGIVYESLTLVYGADASISPGPAQNPFTRTDSSKAAGNNFSGTQILSPFIGAESYINQIAVGGRFISNIFSAQYVEDNGEVDQFTNERKYFGNNQTNSFHLEGFVEFPVYKKIDVGLVIGAGRGDMNVLRYFEGGNEYLGQLYSQYKFDKETAATASLTSQVTKIPNEKNTTDLSIGLRRSL